MSNPLAGQIAEFLEFIRFTRRYSQHTQDAYRRDLEQFAAYLTETHGEEVATGLDVRHGHIRAWLAAAHAASPLAATTRNRKTSALNSFFRHLQARGEVLQNPTRLLHAVKTPERLPQFLKTEEAGNLLDKHPFGEDWDARNHRIICELLYAAGLRRAELIGLRDGDLQSPARLRVVGKGNKERLVPISAAMEQAIRDYQAEKAKHGIATEGGPMLVLENGRPLYATYVYRAVRRHLSDVCTLKKRSPHILRHTFATHLLNNGANIQSIKELLGHSSLAATQIYTHNSIEMLKDIHRNHHPRG